jgi:predicted nucleotidyltransferase
MRLTQNEKDSIKKTFLEVFGDGEIYLFGSRVDDSKRGGDIDLFIRLPYCLNSDDLFDKKSEFRLKLYRLIGEQKIDTVFSKDKPTSIEKTALQTGVLL